ncbi:MAG: hypothetical protein AB8G15_04100 [Saprospiraceae bacterium]
MVKFFLICLPAICLSFLAQANDLILQSKSATALNNVILYTDTSFTQHSNISYQSGTLFEIIGQSYLEHEDDAQNQKFKWFKVRANDQQEGWIFGDGLAVIVPKDQVDPQLKKFHQQKVSFNSGFENSMMWVAAIQGRDNFHEQDFLNPPYKEFYLVITNPAGRSVHINYAGLSARGKNELRQFQLQDVTGDGISEFILQRATQPVASDLAYRSVEIFAIQAGTIAKIFSEEMNLNYGDDSPSPALHKFIEIEDQTIRVAYIDYVPNKKYSLPYDNDPISQTQERCLEYVTYTYQWNERQKQYQMIYEVTRTAPIAGTKKHGVIIQDKPKLSGKYICPINKSDRLKVIKHFEKTVIAQGKKKTIAYLYVLLPSGKAGYLPAHEIGFVESEHAALLNKFYLNPPLVKSNWKTTDNFLKILPGRATDTSQK